MVGTLVRDVDALDCDAGAAHMFHLILHVWYKSGAKRDDYFWDYALLEKRLKKLEGNDRVERYEIEDRRRERYVNTEKA